MLMPSILGENLLDDFLDSHLMEIIIITHQV